MGIDSERCKPSGWLFPVILSGWAGLPNGYPQRLHLWHRPISADLGIRSAGPLRTRNRKQLPAIKPNTL